MAALCALLADEDLQVKHMVSMLSPHGSQLQVLQSQVSDLRTERSRLLHQLQETKAAVSQRGVRLVGLSPEHIKMVRSYACELHAGRHPDNDAPGQHYVALPSLQCELDQLKLAQKNDKDRITRLLDE